MKKILLYFGDVFWCTTPYVGVSIFYELSKDYDVIPVFHINDIRTSKTWRGNEKFWFDKTVFHKLPYEEISGEDSNSLLNLYKSSGAQLLLMPSHMQFKTPFALRNRFLKENGVKICFWDTSGGDGLFCDSNTTGWEYFLTKGSKWKEIMKDSEKFPKFPGVRMKENPENIFVTGSPEFDQLVIPADKASFCKKYGLDMELPIVAYLPGNPRPDNTGNNQKLMAELHSGLLRLQSLNYQICFKSHPSDYISTESQNVYYAVHPRARLGGYSAPRYMLDPFNRFTLINAEDGFDLYKICDFAVTNLSHVGFELALINKPIVSYNMVDYVGWHMCDNLCELIYTDVQTSDELVDVCTKMNFKPPTNDARLDEFLFFPNEGSVPHMVKAIDEILLR